MYKSLKGGERSGDSSPRVVGANFAACALNLAPGNSLLDSGTSPTDLKRGRANLSIFLGA